MKTVKFKTSNKAFRTQVESHVYESLSEDSTTDVKQQLQNTVKAFEDWFKYELKRDRNASRQIGFEKWLMCLPSEMSIEYTSHGIYTTLKTWFENCEQVYKEREADVEEELYLRLVSMAFIRICKKHEITF